MKEKYIYIGWLLGAGMLVSISIERILDGEYGKAAMSSLICAMMVVEPAKRLKCDEDEPEKS